MLKMRINKRGGRIAFLHMRGRISIDKTFECESEVEKVLGFSEARRILGVSGSVLRRWLNEGYLIGRQTEVGGHWLVSKSYIDALLGEWESSDNERREMLDEG
jgi:hypothetical protein